MMIILGSLERLPIIVNLTFSLSVTAEALQTNIGSKSAISLQWLPVDAKFQVEGFVPTSHSYSQKTRLNDLLYGVKICTDLYSVLSQCMRLTDRRTDGQREFSSLDSVCISCSVVKSPANSNDISLELGVGVGGLYV